MPQNLTQVVAGLLRGEVTHTKRGGQDRDHDRSAPSATITKSSKSGDVQTTMTVTVPHDSSKLKVQSHEEAPCSKAEGAEEIGNSQNEHSQCQSEDDSASLWRDESI